MESLARAPVSSGGYPALIQDPALGMPVGARGTPQMSRARNPEVASIGGNSADEFGGIAGGYGSGRASGSTSGADGGILRKKLYDQNLSDWTARYRKNKVHLDNVLRDCDQLRNEVARQQQEVDERDDYLRNLEDRFQNDICAKYNDAKGQYLLAAQHKGMLAQQLAESRKHKQALQREKKQLQADFDRKHAELMRKTEVRDKLGQQLDGSIQQLGHLSRDRQRIERELDEVNQNLKAHSELADEVNQEIGHVQEGIKDSVELHMAGVGRPEMSTTSSRGALGSRGGADFAVLKGVDVDEDDMAMNA
eukprot:TRINITY_DN54380_c0_g1_i1.p1 TRINITY_DN54380_c0_g1~~TRINITY_DN54380_c0_g1_i1.p1  ORF type:complete len:307 (+),score=67.06 TRINITY_DN54380_c0_g1_i1:86-1006(+)